MASEGVQPLRITKNNTPSKINGGASPRPLSEISPMGVRRNSPSFNNIAAKPPFAAVGSSPFEASPTSKSPHNFWKSRLNASPARNEPENARPGSVSPTRRASIENLKKASRVTNSSMYAREQDSEVDVDNSTLSHHSTNPWAASINHRTTTSFRGHKRGESSTNIPILSNGVSPSKGQSPAKSFNSPQKSSLSENSRFGPASGAEEAMIAEDGPSRPSTRGNTPRVLRKPKSVSFDEQPPQINEYEMVTPDPSSVASGSREGSYESDTYDMDDSFEGGSFHREDSFDESLEDTAKTPVVLPEDWRFMSPANANSGFAETFEDPFDNPHTATSPSQRYRSTPERDVGVARSNSVNSNGDRRPLPPLPNAPAHERKSSSASTGPMPKPQGVLSSPPRPASMSKADILNLQSSPMPLEERLKLLSIQNEEAAKKANEARQRTPLPVPDEDQTKDKAAGSDSAEELRPPPRVSRESILRKINNQRYDFDYDQEEDTSPKVAVTIHGDKVEYANLDPDVPIQSRETSSTYEEDEFGNRVRREGEIERTISMYSRNGDEEYMRSVSPFEDIVRESSVIHHEVPGGEMSEVEDDTSSAVKASSSATGQATSDDDALPQASVQTPSHDSSRMSLPEFKSFFSNEDFDFGLQSYLTPSPPQEQVDNHSQRLSQSGILISKPDLRPSTPLRQMEPSPPALPEAGNEGAGTPDSVIHCPQAEVAAADESSIEESPSKDMLVVPEPVATIKASGSKLKTRVSATPSDIRQMAMTRRQVSGEQASQIDEEVESEASFGSRESLSLGDLVISHTSETDPASLNRRQSLRKLDVPLVGNSDELGLGLTEEFDRLLEAKKKGYLMRQNTKLVVANSRQPSSESKASATIPEEPGLAPSGSTGSRPGSRSAGSSPRKQGTQTWTTEPWNGRVRRHSTRRTTIVPEKKMTPGPAPPLPGMESNVTNALGSVAEDEVFDDMDDSGERGRLFVKVIGVKELDLPLPKNERCHFQMTLDNGLHCVTTAWAELGRTAPIGQEFELVVFDDLEFQLTLQTRLERPKSSASSVQSSAPSINNTKKTSAFSRLFSSPKKRKEQGLKLQEEEARLASQRQQERDAQQVANREPTAWDLQNELVGPDGSFARAYVALGNHESQAFGRPFTVDIPAWNEWAVEDKAGASTRSKMGGVQRKPPYCIAKMELQLMYIPRPRDAKDEDLPKSMSAAIRQLKEAEATASRTFEGHLSQQGGDCPYWRRRFFKLNGSKLTAYHDMTRQPRATISLAKAVKLIDDKSALTKTEPASPSKSKGRRKSAFAEDEEGYMFVEEGFRIRFANGEVIDFYADDCEQKNAWMRVLAEAVGRESPAEKKTWMSAVIARERAAGSKSSARDHNLSQVKEQQPQAKTTSKATNTIASATSSPKKHVAALQAPSTESVKENKPAPIEKSPRHEAGHASPSKKSTASPKKMASQPQTTVRRESDVGHRDSSPNKRSSTTSASVSSTSPRKLAKEGVGKRKAVRSMIF